MIRPLDVETAIVAQAVLVPALVAAMVSAGNISAYDDAYPVSADREKALRRLKSPGMMLFYDGSYSDTFGNNDAIAHRFSWLIRAADTTSPSQMNRYSDIGYLLHDGVPSTGMLPLKLIQFVPQCYQMDFRAYDPKVDQQGLEYWEFRFNLVEIGDQ